MLDITDVLKAIVTLAVTVVTVIVIPWIRSRTTATQRAELAAWVKIAVEAAEQIYNGSGRGEEKKAYVLEWLENHGITADLDELDAVIEAAVLELNREAAV